MEQLIKLLLNGNTGNVDTPIALNSSNSFNTEPSIHFGSKVVEINQVQKLIFNFYYNLYFS